MDSADREPKISNAFQGQIRNLLEATPRVMHPIWNYILADVLPILRWAEIASNSSRLLQVIQKLIKLPPLTFALGIFAALFWGLLKSLRMAPKLTANILAVAYPAILSLKSINHEKEEKKNWLTYCIFND